MTSLPHDPLAVSQLAERVNKVEETLKQVGMLAKLLGVGWAVGVLVLTYEYTRLQRFDHQIATADSSLTLLDSSVVKLTRRLADSDSLLSVKADTILVLKVRHVLGAVLKDGDFVSLRSNRALWVTSGEGDGSSLGGHLTVRLVRDRDPNETTFMIQRTKRW